MAGVANTARLSARLASRHIAAKPSSRRAFHLSQRCAAAQNYTMPALSPTMTEGNIARWRVQEGDSFSAGDVILEIETDKATMDVEAQDDGMLFKIMEGDGAKGVKVGSRIAVLAEEGDDLKTLEVPAEESKKTESKKMDEGQKQAKQESTSVGGSKEISSQATTSDISKPVAESPPSKPAGQTGQKQRYPLYPAVQHLLRQNNLSTSDADNIPASGPNGRLLKGDVLAYLGKISKDYPAQASQRLEKLAHLDLSNIQIAEKKTQPPPKKADATAEMEVPQETEIAVPISLTAVIATQKRVQDSLGIWLPLSTFIARASALANEALPKLSKPTADDLFNSVLGLDNVPNTSRGHFFPDITGISPAPSPSAAPRRAKKTDIIDMLASKKSRQVEDASPAEITAALGVSARDNVFSVVAKVGEEERATEYLERVKESLEREPGRLVL